MSPLLDLEADATSNQCNVCAYVWVGLCAYQRVCVYVCALTSVVLKSTHSIVDRSIRELAFAPVSQQQSKQTQQKTHRYLKRGHEYADMPSRRSAPAK